MTDPLMFEPLERWAKLSRKSDAQVAELIGISPSKLSRAKRGLHPLPMEDQLALQEITGITPAEWADFYARAVKARSPKKKLSLAANRALRRQKKLQRLVLALEGQ